MSAKLLPVGFFPELKYGSAGPTPTLRESVRAEPQPDEALIAAYLRGGTLLVISGASARDELDPERKWLGSRSCLTDGAWIWPAELAHYVAVYHIALPAELVDHMRARDFRPPTLTESEIRVACEQMTKIGTE